jgi:hypothetical protein
VADYLMPTSAEREKLMRNIAWQRRLATIVFLPMIPFAIIRLLPDMPLWITVAVAVVPISVMLGMIIYTSFLLRCPRCKTWVGVAAPKCASCGLKSKV